MVDSFKSDEKNAWIILFQGVIRRCEVAKLDDGLSELRGWPCERVCQRPDTLAPHHVNIVHLVLDQALDDASVEAFMDHLGGLGGDVCQWPDDLFPDNLLLVVDLDGVDGQNASLDDRLGEGGVVRRQNVADSAHGRYDNLDFFVLEQLD